MPAADGNRLPREQRPAGDPGPARQPGQLEDRRRDVGEHAVPERATSTARPAMTIGTGFSEWAVIGPPSGVRSASALPWSAVTTRRASDGWLARDPEGGHDPPEARIDRLDRADRRVPVAGVADHVRVGVVRDQDVVVA